MQGGQSGRLINQERTWELNLTVLQRLDENIQEILFTAAHVSLYDFDVDKCQWVFITIEGKVFSCTANLVEDVLDGFECEVQVPYLLYRNAADEVNGIWFYNSRECEEVASLLARISNAYSKTPPKQIFSPRNDFTELESVRSSAVVEEPLEPTAASTAAVGPPKDSLERFFSDVLNLNVHQPPGSLMLRSPAATHASSTHASVNIATKYKQVQVTPPPPPPPPQLQPPANSLALDNSNLGSEALLKPYFYVPPPLPASQTSTSHHHVLQPSVGAPLLQPFPPPTSFSLASSSMPTTHPVISKEGIRDALFTLVQSDAFIDLIYEELLRAHR